MQFHNANADLYIPDGAPEKEALERTTHLCVGAHPDDIETMAYHGVAACFGRTDRWFTGVTSTDGAGSARSGRFAKYTDDDMKRIRVGEQRKAALVGEYSCQFQLGYTSGQVKAPGAANPFRAELKTILEAARPEVVYLHNLADKHETHVAVAMHALAVLRGLPAEIRPKKVYGCEVWRDLDWLADEHKQVLSVSAYPWLWAALFGVFDSQIGAGKRYDLAIPGHWRFNASYHASHSVDEDTAIEYAIDLTPLVEDPSLDPVKYTCRFIKQFYDDVEQRLTRLS